MADVSWRTALDARDPRRIRDLVARTGRFSEDEIAIAEELPLERIEKGPASGYEFVIAMAGERMLGYACYGLIPGSEQSWDLYWIAVEPSHQGEGLGGRIMEKVDAAIRAAGGRFIHIDTSTSPPYAATRSFYRRQGFDLAVEFPDFYRDGDGKAVFVKDLRK